MKYITIKALTDKISKTLPKLTYRKTINHFNGVEQDQARVSIGDYEYIFAKCVFPPDNWLRAFWPKDLYKKLIPEYTGSVENIPLKSNRDLQGIRFDVCYVGQTPDMSDDLGDQHRWKLVIDLMLNELKKIASKGKNFWIVNDTLNDSSKRDRMYDKAALKLSQLYGYNFYKFKIPGNRENYRFMKK